MAADGVDRRELEAMLQAVAGRIESRTAPAWMLWRECGGTTRITAGM
jgi:hypothetical protein